MELGALPWVILEILQWQGVSFCRTLGVNKESGDRVRGGPEHQQLNRIPSCSPPVPFDMPAAALHPG